MKHLSSRGAERLAPAPDSRTSRSYAKDVAPGNGKCINTVDHTFKACIAVRVIPFFLVLVILVFGAVTAVDTFNSPPDAVAPTVVRPTVTPRPRPTSPRPSETVEPALPSVVAPTSTPVPAPTPVVPAPTALATPVATPAATTPGQSVMKVGNTDRAGVYIRRTPNLDDKIRPWMDGTAMTILGPPQTTPDGTTWLNVRAPDGVEGYIPSQYLVPQ
jgi:hypothetical protein